MHKSSLSLALRMSVHSRVQGFPGWLQSPSSTMLGRATGARGSLRRLPANTGLSLRVLGQLLVTDTECQPLPQLQAQSEGLSANKPLIFPANSSESWNKYGFFFCYFLNNSQYFFVWFVLLIVFLFGIFALKTLLITLQFSL